MDISVNSDPLKSLHDLKVTCPTKIFILTILGGPNNSEILTKIKVVHAVCHQHIMKQSQARIVVPREERIVSVRPADISLCHNTNKHSSASTSTAARTDNSLKG